MSFDAKSLEDVPLGSRRHCSPCRDVTFWGVDSHFKPNCCKLKRAIISKLQTWSPQNLMTKRICQTVVGAPPFLGLYVCSGRRKNRYHKYQDTPLNQEWLEVFELNLVCGRRTPWSTMSSNLVLQVSAIADKNAWRIASRHVEFYRSIMRTKNDVEWCSASMDMAHHSTSFFVHVPNSVQIPLAIHELFK